MRLFLLLFGMRSYRLALILEVGFFTGNIDHRGSEFGSRLINVREEFLVAVAVEDELGVFG